MEQAARDILTPVLEASIVLAAHYVKCCGRDIVTKEDLQYALKYNAMNNVGTHIGTLFPEIYDEESSDEDESFVTDDDCEFTRYTGNDEWCLKMNKAYDEWEQWNPSGPAEVALKNSIDSIVNG